jgi:hypothetical protein
MAAKSAAKADNSLYSALVNPLLLSLRYLSWASCSFCCFSNFYFSAFYACCSGVSFTGSLYSY